MEENFDALEVIARTRGKVDLDDMPTGKKLFPLWGWLTAFFYLLAFALWHFLHQEWCLWLWIGIPIVGFPLMIGIIRRDRERTHMRTRRSRLVLDYWIFAALAIGAGGFALGFSGLYEMIENPLICILVGIGAFITGEEIRFRPMIIGGVTAVAIGICSFLLQGELWSFQMLCVVLVAIVSLIIPGHLFERSVKNGV